MEMKMFSLEKRKLRGELYFTAPYGHLKGDFSEVGAGLFSQIASGRMRGNCLKSCQWRFRWEKFLPWKGYHALEQAASEVTQSPCLEVSERCAGRALRDMGCWCLAVWDQQLDWTILKHFSNLNHSMIICPKTDKANTWTYFFAKTTNYTDY